MPERSGSKSTNNLTGAAADYFLESLPENAAGRVHSVFASSFNVITEGFLVHVGNTAQPLSCLGFQLGSARMREVLACIRVGDLALFRGGMLRIYGRDNTEFLPYQELPRVSLCLRAGRKTGGVPAPERLFRLLSGMALEEKIGLAWNRELRQALRGLGRAPEAQLAAIRFLLGRGPGLTPSGDDILTGFTTGLWMLGRERTFPQMLKDSLNGQTTDVSLAYLQAAAEGYANGDYLALCRALTEADDGVCRRVLKEISSHGHTSGKDSLLGLRTAMAAVLTESCDEEKE